MKPYLASSFCATLLGLLPFMVAPTSAAPYSILHSFRGTNYADGAGPSAQLVLSGLTLYGTTYAGGISNAGVIYKINTDGSGYEVIRHCSVGLLVDDASPGGPLKLVGSKLYGTASGWAMWQSSTAPVSYTERRGGLFCVDTNGANYSQVVMWGGSYYYGVNPMFSPSEKAFPKSGVVASGPDLYGIVNDTLFAVGTNGLNFRLLNTLASYSDSPLTLAGNTLYGVTISGGISNCGTVIAINIVTTNYTTLKAFSLPIGASPSGRLLITNDTIFGVTQNGGDFDKGTLYRMNANGSDFTVLKHFSGNDGANPRSGLVCSGTKLYGTTGVGGMFNHGTIFQITTNGTGFVTLKHFNGADGDEPSGELVWSEGVLYGTAMDGGDANLGVVFSLRLGLQLLNPVCDGTSFTFSILTSSNLTYAVEACDDLSLTNWVQLDTVTGNDATVNYSAPMTSGAQRFFRVREE